MPTRFGRFISKKFFAWIFLALYVLFMCFAAYETDAAFCTVLGQTHLYGISYVMFVISAVLCIAKKDVCAKRKSHTLQKFISFLSCILIYYLMLLSIWVLFCLLLGISTFVKAVGILTMCAASIFIVIFGYLHTRTIKVVRYTIPVGNGKTECRIALLSDIHLGCFVGASHVEKMVYKTNRLNPDIVVISGDIFDTDKQILDDSTQLKKISKQLRKLKVREGVYAVVGNHDPKVDDDRFVEFLRASKIKLLDNDVAVLSKINLIGRTDAANNERKPFVDMLAQTKKGKPMIVLDHKPQGIDEAAANGAALVLSGHTHQGQFFPVSLLTMWANGKHYFYGHERIGDTHGIITSGVGFFELPVRIGTSNEVADIRVIL